MSVYLSVAPPDGFVRWAEPDWDRWLRDHPWEAAERICSRGDWAIFLFQLRAHADQGKRLLEPHLEALVNERPVPSQAADDLRAGFELARKELGAKPAAKLREAQRSNFVGEDDLEAMIAAARARRGGDPSMADVWAEVFDQVQKVLAHAAEQRRGVYFGNL